MPASNTAWGIEVGWGAVKALKVEREGDTLRVADFVIVPHKKVLSTPDLNRDDAIAVALGGFMSQFRESLRGSVVAMSIPGHSAFARFARLPPVEKRGIANLVRFEAVQQIPFPINDVEWDYQTFASEDSPDVEVGIFAVTKAKIAEILAAYEEQGLQPDIITLSPLAVYNAVAYDLAFTATTPGTVILDIGTTASDLIIAEGGRVWIRTFPLGGHNFTEILASTFKLTYGKAERLKKEAETSKYKRHIFQALRPVLQELIQDVQRSITYYRDTHPSAEISRVIGVGSTFRLIGLRKLLSQQLRLDVYRYERTKRLHVEGPAASDFEAATPNMATAYGLALQGLGLETISANLMPVPILRQAMWKRKTPWFMAAACVGLAAGALSFLRPLLDSMTVARARADSSITTPIRQTLALGQQLRAKWNEVSQGKQPGFVAENMRRLLEGRDLYPQFLGDLSGMFDAAARHARDRALAADTPIAELRGYQTEYLPPGQPFAGASGSPGHGRDFGGQPAETPVAASAGPAGAVRFTLVFDSPLDSRPFVNDSFLAWLRGNANRPGVPYTLTAIPAASEIPIQPIAPPAPASAPSPGRTPPGAPPPRPPPGPGSGPAPLGGDRDDGGGSPPPIGGRSPTPPPQAPSPSKPSSPGPAGKPDVDLDRLAPIPPDVLAPPRTATAYRYTITWIAQLRPASEMEQGQAGGQPDPQEP